MFHSTRPLLGRHAERQAIHGLRAAARDELSGALLTGEPGIGKARLLQIIPRKAQHARAHITEIHASHAVALTQPAAVAEHIAAAAAAQTRPGMPA